DLYNESLDVWSVGVLLFELITGTVPWPSSPGTNIAYEVQEKLMLRGMFETLGVLSPFPSNYQIPIVYPGIFPLHSPEQLKHFLTQSELKTRFETKEDFHLGIDFFQRIFVYEQKQVKRATTKEVL